MSCGYSENAFLTSMIGRMIGGNNDPDVTVERIDLKYGNII